MVGSLDSVTLARPLEVVITARNVRKSYRVGIPIHRREVLARLRARDLGFVFLASS